MKKNKLSYDEKLRLALENGDLIYEEMHEEYKVPYSKRGLIFWRIKNYFKGMFRNIPSLLLWTLISQESFTGGEDSFGEAAAGWIADQMKKK